MNTPVQDRILVTGGAGFIGSALVWALNQRGQTDIVVADFLEPSKHWHDQVPLSPNADDKRKNLQPLRFAEFIEADTFKERITAKPGIFGRFATVFHLGACSSTTERNRPYLEDVNVDYSRHLARWALAQGARFIYASSAATYGDGSAGMEDQDENIARLHPLNLYGQSKQDFDLFAQGQGWLDRIVGLKYFNVFGPNEGHKGDMRSLVHKAFEQITATGRLRLFKSHRPDYRDGEQKRDFLYVKDAVEMTLHFAEKGRTASGLYNLGSGQANTWLTLADAIFNAMGKPLNIEFIDMPEELRGRYQYFTQADITKLRSVGYSRPLTPLAEAVRDYVQNYLLPGKRLGDHTTFS
ncbi:MAG: ADP-glyceromanno-heptose 6-epimerase [Opitutaceae bacterium]|nr:ADP-glyceromanno-heptose 6-epimerase [Opitutaceae bacterium]